MAECCKRYRWIGVLALWLGALAASALLDHPVANWLHASGLDRTANHHWFSGVVKLPGTYWSTLAVAAVLLVGHRMKWRAARFVCLSGLVALLNATLKGIIGRIRPFCQDPLQALALRPDFFEERILRLVHGQNLAFPSGHACMAFATAEALAILLPRWRWPFYTVAAVVGLERIVENAHYVSDVVAGAAVGIWGMRLVWWICVRVVEKSQTRTPPRPPETVDQIV